MRKYYFFSFLFLALQSLSFAQIDTTAFLQYFPLNHGNIWQYECRYYEHAWDTVEVVDYFTREIVGDTVMPNRLCYKITCEKYSDYSCYRFFRIDTASLKVLEYTSGCCQNNEVDFLYLFGSIDSTIDISSCQDAYSEVTLSTDSLLNISTNWTTLTGYTLKKNIGITNYYAAEAGPATTHSLIAARINGIQTGTFLSMDATPLANDFALLRTFPNPFNPVLTIQYTLEMSDPVILKIYNIAGQLVDVLVNERQPAGQYSVQWNGTGRSSGIYLISLSIADKQYFLNSR